MSRTSGNNVTPKIGTNVIAERQDAAPGEDTDSRRATQINRVELILSAVISVCLALAFIFVVVSLQHRISQREGTKFVSDFRVESLEGTTVSLTRYGVPYSIDIHNAAGLKRPTSHDSYLIVQKPDGETELCSRGRSDEPCYEIRFDTNGSLAKLLAETETYREFEARFEARRAKRDAESRFPANINMQDQSSQPFRSLLPDAVIDYCGERAGGEVSIATCTPK